MPLRSPRLSRPWPEPPDWARDGYAWPHRDASRFVVAGDLRWHVQLAGGAERPAAEHPTLAKPRFLLVHGTGAATHSWGGLLPLLAAHALVVAPDLPGHGFTAMPASGRLSLPGMATALDELLRMLDYRPDIALGHSAGAAILARLCLDGRIAPRLLVGLAAALLPLRGMAGALFSPAARLLARTSLAARIVAADAHRPGAVEQLVAHTGSRLAPEGMALYRLLVQRPGHVAAALRMMAHWDLMPLQRDLPRLSTPLLLIYGTTDRMVPPDEAARVLRLVPRATAVALAGLGHLAHEEAPERVAAVIWRHLAP